MTEITTHYKWDMGVLEEILNQFGIGFGEPKTTLTLCGKRVPYKRIDNTAPTCELCKEDRAEQLAILEEMRLDGEI